MKKSQKSDISPKDRLLPRLTLAFSARPLLTGCIWLVLVVFGILSYTTLLRREGFPSIAIPIVVVNGSYAVNNPAEVDQKLAAPISQIAMKQAGFKMVSSQSAGNFFSTTVEYTSDIDAPQAKRALENAVRADTSIPAAAQLYFAAPYFGVTGGSTSKVDATISVYGNGATSLPQLVDQANKVQSYLQAHKPSQIEGFQVSNPFKQVNNPVTGQAVTIQKTFDRYGQRADGKNTFNQSVIIDVASIKDADVIKMDNQLRDLLQSLQSHRQAAGVTVDTAISASYAPAIRDEISELQRVLLEGLVAVLIIGSIIIATRAAIITVLSMLTVIATTLGLLYLFGYTLNVITLFALILGLSLIVDDTIIMVEALDAARRQATSRRQAIAEATRKISRAMLAATLTACLSFAPLLFVNGILGNFIRAIPATIISALIISLLVALIFIPFFARQILLGKKHLSSGGIDDEVRRFELKIASLIARPMIWARHSRRKEWLVGLSAILIGLTFIAAGGFVFSKVTFNIFPPSKDSNELAVQLTYPANTSVQQAETIAARADAITGSVLGKDFQSASYYASADEQAATLHVELLPYSQRSRTSPQMVDDLKQAFQGFDGARVTAYQVDIGPPTSTFKVDITADKRADAEQLARDMAGYLQGLSLQRTSGTTAHITTATASNFSFYNRTNNRQIVSVDASFDGTDTTTLTTLAKKAVTDRYTASKLAEFNLKPSDVTFDLGQESDNQNSFKSLALAFPIVLLAIYLLLLTQFRSFLQPLLIFMALPFSFFGIALGLYYTHNAFSFFSMLGFFALIGLSIKNTILLTDYANQAKRAGMGSIDAIVAALGERFRPLIATSLTAVVSLIPLAISSPFWQSLAVTLIFGLLSSTFLVITVFPYLFLGAEYLRYTAGRLASRH